LQDEVLVALAHQLHRLRFHHSPTDEEEVKNLVDETIARFASTH
jgi:hypothetical protein